MDETRSDSSELLARSRREQGLPAQLEDDAVIERLVVLLSSVVVDDDGITGVTVTQCAHRAAM